MGVIKEVISYYKRRVSIPKEFSGLVLDVGSGDKPHAKADILVDRYISEEYGIQRMGSSKVKIDRPIFDSDICDLPFKDKVFDYTIASHILEHVHDPLKAVKELTRVSKAGYIEVPYCGYQKITDYYSHLWYCDYKNGILSFTAKSNQFFDKDIDNFITENGKKIDIGRIPKDKDKCVIKIYWKNTIKVKINGIVNKKLVEEISNMKVDHNNTSYALRQLFEKTISILFPRKNKFIYMNKIIKEEFQNNKNILLRPKIYKLKKQNKN